MEKTSDTRTQILLATIELIKINDISEISIRSIANHVGISKGTIFHHFKTKDAIMYYAMEMVYFELLDQVSKIHNETKTEKEVLPKVTYMMLDFFTSNPGLIQLFILIFNRFKVDISLNDPSDTEINIVKDFMYPIYHRAGQIFQELGYEKPIIQARLYLALVDGIALQIFVENIKGDDPLVQEFANGVISKFTSKTL